LTPLLLLLLLLLFLSLLLLVLLSPFVVLSCAFLLLYSLWLIRALKFILCTSFFFAGQMLHLQGRIYMTCAAAMLMPTRDSTPTHLQNAMLEHIKSF
jgi:hypothetical protein